MKNLPEEKYWSAFALMAILLLMFAIVALILLLRGKDVPLWLSGCIVGNFGILVGWLFNKGGEQQ